MYCKRKGTSGVCGQLYESKLISLLYFRATHDDTIEEFQLASNVDNIGAFDDICFKAKIKGHEKPLMLFIQAKHKENEKHALKHDLATYYNSYMRIRNAFNTTNEDMFFRRAFEETECLFIIYTNATDNFSNESAEGSFFSHLNNLINSSTDGTAKQPYKHVNDVEFLREAVVKYQIATLAERIAEFISKKLKKSLTEVNLQNVLLDELVQSYHVVLARNVFDVSEIEPLQSKNAPRHRIATFRPDFFDNNEEYVKAFKDNLCSEILKRRIIKPTDKRIFLTELVADPTADVTKLSKLIGTVVTYNNGQLEYIDKKSSTKDFLPPLTQVQVSQSTVNEAVKLAAKGILLPRKYKVPAAFGNKDLRLSEAKVESRIDYLVSGFKDLLVKCKSSNLVTIDESLVDGFLRNDGGIGSAVGNIFVLDDNTKVIKITDNTETLGELAKKLYEKLNTEIPNLLEYEFCFKVNKFPKLSFNSDLSEYETSLARDFLNKLLFYSSQGNEQSVEDILKSEIVNYESQCEQQIYFEAKTDAIFLKYHDEIQQWWKQLEQAEYLTRESDLFQKAKQNIISDPLLSVLNAMYQYKIKQYNYTFTEDAVSSLNLQEQHSTTVVITENSVLTVVKVMQCLKYKGYAVLDLEYIVKLPPVDRNALCRELKQTSEGKVFILVYNEIQQDRMNNLGTVAKAVFNKKNIIVTTSHESVKSLQRYFPKHDNTVHDKNNSLMDMSEESQKSICENASVVFQGINVRLGAIVDDQSMAYVKGDVLNKIITEETIALGTQLGNRNYNGIKHLYVDRRVTKVQPCKDSSSGAVKTLNYTLEIPDDVVLVTAGPAMGKSTLLTHLSLRTKELHPEIWIVRINLLKHSREFSKWKEEKTVIDTLETLKFMCQAILREHFGEDNEAEITLGVEDGAVYLKHCTADPLIEFELDLFLHFFNNRKMILLFDGFDEICPHYTNEVMKYLTSVNSNPRKHRMWLTSRPYNEVKTILQQEFGSSYEIEEYSYEETEKYLQTFWEFNLRLEELNSTQLKNVKEFLDNISGVNFNGIPGSLFAVIEFAARYMKSVISNTHIPLWTYAKEYHDFFSPFFLPRCDGNPLYLYLAATYVKENIKKGNNQSEKWYLNLDANTVYERFLESQIKRQYEEKNGMNICYPKISSDYEKELEDSILEHKQLGAYAIFQGYSQRLFSVQDLEQIKNMIKDLEKGEDNSGLIDSVANGIPIFSHMTFAEYFAVGYICDCLNKENISETLVICFNAMFTNDSLENIRNIFNHKLHNHKTLLSTLESNKEIIYNWLMEQGRSIYVEKSLQLKHWALLYPMFEHLPNLDKFFRDIIDCYLNDTTLIDFLEIVKCSTEIRKHSCMQQSVYLSFVLHIVAKFDKSKSYSILRDRTSWGFDLSIVPTHQLKYLEQPQGNV